MGMRRTLAATIVLLAVLAPCANAATRTFSGRLEVTHSDDFAHGRGQTSWTLRTKGGRRLPLRPTRMVSTRSGARVKVRGHRVGRWVEGKVIERGGPKVKAASALGTHRVAVLLVNFSDDSSQPWSPAYVTQRVFTDPDSTAAFYDEESHGNIAVTGQVFGWYTLPDSRASCSDADVDRWAADARSAASSHGVDLSSYDNVMYVFPDQASCGWAGLGEVPGSQTWINGDLSVRVLAHELGHNLGLHHASSYRCTRNGVAVTWSSSCTASEYGDPYDVMGLYAHHSNAWHLAQLGVVTGAHVKTVSSSGTYTIQADGGAGTTLLRVPTGGSTARWYDLSLRQPVGSFWDNFSSSSPIVNGVSLHWDPATSVITQSLLLDGTPGTSSFSDAALPAGTTFSDGSNTIAVTSVTPGQATVSVLVGQTADIDAPTRPGNFTAQPVQGGADLAWTASTDNVGVAGYRIVRDDAIVASTTGLGYSDRGLTPGTLHKYQVTAYDAAGNAMPSLTRWVQVPDVPDPGPQGSGGDTGSGDVTPPVVRLLSPHRGARLRGRATVLARASDDAGVARTELFIDGRLVAVADGPRLRRTWILRRVRPGAHTLRARAIDEGGNSASRSTRVRVLRGP